MDILVQEVRLEQMDLLDTQVLLDTRDLMGQLVTEARQVIEVLQDQVAFRDTKVHEEALEALDQEAIQVLGVLLFRKVIQVLRAQLEDIPGLKDIRDQEEQ